MEMIESKSESNQPETGGLGHLTVELIEAFN